MRQYCSTFVFSLHEYSAVLMLVLKIIKQSLKQMHRSDSQLKDFCYICYYLKQVFNVSFSFLCPFSDTCISIKK